MLLDSDKGIHQLMKYNITIINKVINNSWPVTNAALVYIKSKPTEADLCLIVLANSSYKFFIGSIKHENFELGLLKKRHK